MRLRILSDLHVEFGHVELPPCDADVVVLAGDIHQGLESPAWIRRQFPEQPVVWVAGNHEFYHQSVPSLLDQFRAACRDTNIHFLENEAVTIGGFTFLGCTLWTDFRLLGDEQQVDAWAQAAALITDFRRIRLEPEGRLLRSTDTIPWHEASRRWLEGEMARHDPRHTIMVTHHAPSARSLPAAQSRQLLSAAFASNLDALVERSRARLWIHGHTHHCTRYHIGETEVIANSRGYPKEVDPAFDPGLTVEI